MLGARIAQQMLCAHTLRRLQSHTVTLCPPCVDAELSYHVFSLLTLTVILFYSFKLAEVYETCEVTYFLYQSCFVPTKRERLELIASCKYSGITTCLPHCSRETEIEDVCTEPKNQLELYISKILHSIQ